MKMSVDEISMYAERAIEAAYALRRDRVGELLTDLVAAGDPQDCYVWTCCCLAVVTGADGVHPVGDLRAAAWAHALMAVPLDKLHVAERFSRMAVAYATGDVVACQAIFSEGLGSAGDAQLIGDLMGFTLWQARNAVIVNRRSLQ